MEAHSINSYPQNTSFDGDYGNATGPDGTYTGLLLQTGGI
jgi:hypothetical protein